MLLRPSQYLINENDFNIKYIYILLKKKYIKDNEEFQESKYNNLCALKSSIFVVRGCSYNVTVV